MHHFKLRERISVERNAPTDHDLALQREIANRSRGPSSTASSSVASSASSAYATSQSTNYSLDEFRRLNTRGSAGDVTDLRRGLELSTSLMLKDEHIRDQDMELAKKDMEVQGLRSDIRKKEEEIRKKDEELRKKDEGLRKKEEGLRKKDEELKSAETQFAKREQELKAQLRQREAEMTRKEAEFAKHQEEHKAELRKRDRAMKGLNKLYEDLNLEQDELFNRCNEELVSIARASAAVGNGRSGEDLWKGLERAMANESAMRKEIQ